MNKGRVKPIVTNTHYLRKGTQHFHNKLYRDKLISYAIDTGNELLTNAKHYEKHGKSGCVGLASNQIGLNKVDMFVAKANGEWKVFTEPHLHMSSKHYYAKESCLSLPKLKHQNLKVYRFEVFDIKFLHWEALTCGDMIQHKLICGKDFTRFESQVFQHEQDHLGGTLITSNNAFVKKEARK